MRFTLFYEGDLPPSGNAQDKWRIRKQLDPQMRALWNSPPVVPMKKYLDRGDPAAAGLYVGRSQAGIEFMPMIGSALGLRAELEVLLLSADLPGGFLVGGDIDNRFKTLLDALSMPVSPQQIPAGAAAGTSDGRIFCLLEDDKYVVRLDVHNDRLLSASTGLRDVKAIIRVRPTAFEAGLHNLGIAS